MAQETIIITAAVAAIVLLAELLHLRRIRRVRHLAFGPGGRAASWTGIVPVLRTAAAALLAWGLTTLIFDVEAKQHRLAARSEGDWRHLILVLDVSPSMRLEDAGPEKEQSRKARARDVLDSMFSRVAIGQYKITVVATYTGAIPVVTDTVDSEVVRNVLNDLPMHYAFKSGETRLFDGLEEAAKIAKAWPKDSTTLVVASDGDTVPPTGMPKMPPSINGVLVVGLGDSVKGSFINGRNSRQDVSALRQMALRLGGAYHDGNQRHVATDVLDEVTTGAEKESLLQLSRREYALLAIALGALLLALLPLALQLLGSRWAAVRPISRRARAA
ncbi:MAG: Ca-activated chloride channel family protein [Planctomycetota bacterium]|jgi:Ca-activated chloride channel family protein